ncbi:uncharacterized protein F5Z01DRAFT_447689 [Emericellopsis atlantica]|uniref:Uncharacterized protein n=1 Tax=Emericellopsis atlantica TaxID=2614577 RepID=A0A9P8CRH2_9HYPO|nr:uncharacterized protein F5Z01DRAFT_447689 [Emericellopsis atlantica]KAG9257024.1 hypothetical protein F5Z01DRAFT_447689 [Emericellopsis atlantica]
MANGLDRLEKFFSKRKASITPSEASTAPSSTPSSPTQPALEPSFPSPSFIRPKTSRMAAREEVTHKQTGPKPSRTPNGFSPVRKPSANSSRSGCTATSRRARASRVRSSSLGSIQHEQLLSVLGALDDPKSLIHEQFQGPSWSDFSLNPLSKPSRSNESRPTSPLHISIPPISRLDTPPSSDPEDSPLAQHHPKTKRRSRAIPWVSPLTPDASPELGPVAEWQLDDQPTLDIRDESLCRDIQKQLDQPFGKPEVGCFLAQPDSRCSAKSDWDDVLSPAASTPSLALSEPTFNDFMQLDDVTVAESVCGDDLTRQHASAFSCGPLLTLEPPSVNATATAAAHQAARIASKFDFDMLYLVNLWPEQGSSRHGSESAMTGRILAAYGLHNVPSPFQISEKVHSGILRADGWLEHRDDQPSDGEFARAYACAFYPGRYEESSTARCASIDDQDTIDRGLVFAAYRKPRADAKVRDSDTEELERLRCEVETMVDVVIDIHVAHQLRQPPLMTAYCLNSGPMPSS